MKEYEALPVIALQALEGRDPDISFCILLEACGRVGYQSIPYSQMIEEVLLLGVQEGSVHQEQADEEDPVCAGGVWFVRGQVMLVLGG